MYQWLNPEYKVKNINEEFPQIFKLLGYPFVINQSTMKTVNVPHSWPTILGALHWLSELIMVKKTKNRLEYLQILVLFSNSI